MMDLAGVVFFLVFLWICRWLILGIMRRELRPAIVAMVVFTVLTGLVYPLAMTGLAQVLFPAKRKAG